MSEEKDTFNEAEGMPEGLQFLTYEEAAKILRIKRASVRTLVYRGDIRNTLKQGRKSLIPLSELRRYVAKRTKVNEKKVFPSAPKPEEVGSPHEDKQVN